MERFQTTRKSNSALYLLFSEGCCFLLISVAVLACGFVLNFHKDFDYDLVDAEHDYTQYWVGLVLLITAFLAISAGTRQRTRWVVVIAMFLFFVTILVSLFALVVEGNDWIQHKNAVRRIEFWESEDYICTSPTSTSCACSKPNEKNEYISEKLDCDELERLNYLYGTLICCILAAIFLALSSIIVVMIFIPIRPLTVPVPKKRIRKITVLEDREPKPIVVAKPVPRRIAVQPKPEVEEIILTERQPQRMRMIAEPKPVPIPKTEVEEIVVRERKPQRTRTIVYDEPREQQVIYRAPQRTRTLIYDEPRPETGPMPVRTLVPVETEPREVILAEGKPDQPGEDDVYGVGRFVAKVHPTPPRQQSEPGIEEGFVVNPNFKKPSSTVVQHNEPEPVYYGRAELGPVRYVREEPEQIRYVRREEIKPEPVRYVKKPTIVYEQRPRVAEDRALVPVRRSVARPKAGIVVHSRNPQPSYIIERPGQRPLIAVRRGRANSDEGPGLMRAREVPPRRPPPRRVYTAQPVRTGTTGQGSKMVWQRVRSNSDEGPRLYRERHERGRPARIYTDKEITMAGNVTGPAKPKVFTQENIATASLGQRPATAQVTQAKHGEYDRNLEATLESVDKWNERPNIPY